MGSWLVRVSSAVPRFLVDLNCLSSSVLWFCLATARSTGQSGHILEFPSVRHCRVCDPRSLWKNKHDLMPCHFEAHSHPSLALKVSPGSWMSWDIFWACVLPDGGMLSCLFFSELHKQILTCPTISCVSNERSCSSLQGSCRMPVVWFSHSGCHDWNGKD